jgi:hypothetical protein
MLQQLQVQLQDQMTGSQVGSDDHHENDHLRHRRCSIRSLGSGIYESDGSIISLRTSMTTTDTDTNVFVTVAAGEVRRNRNHPKPVSASIRCDTHIYDEAQLPSLLQSSLSYSEQEMIQVVFDNTTIAEQLGSSSGSSSLTDIPIGKKAVNDDDDEEDPSLPQLISSTSMQSTPGSSICSSSNGSSHGSSSSSITTGNKNRGDSDTTSDSDNDQGCCASTEDELSSNNSCCPSNDDELNTMEIEDHNNEVTGTTSTSSTYPIPKTVSSSLESESSSSLNGPCQRSDPDVYGQRHPIESPTLIATKLQEFNSLIQQQIDMYNSTTITTTTKFKTTKSNEPKFMIAERLCPNITTSTFKLLFLRCECYDVENTMKRYIRYWDKRVELFGNTRAYQPFTIETLEQYDHIKPYEMGLHIIQRTKSYTTANGNTNVDTPDERNILWFDASKLDPTSYTRDAGCRSFWYIFHAYLEDEQVQQRGMICINYSAHFTLKNRDPAFTRMCIGSLQGCLPIRISAFHGCHPPTLFRFAIRFFLLLIGERIRKRIIPHFGSEENVIQILEQKYDISRQHIPTDMGGNYILNGIEWLQKRRSAGL